jgi:BlaI family transcriptional regulator, penicillinase repressor
MMEQEPGGGLSEAQLEIMNVVWDRGEATVAEVWKALSGRRSVARNTVQTMIARLEEKGWLRHREEGAAFTYQATRPREATLRQLVRRVVRTAFGGSAEGLVLALVEDEGLTAEEAQRIREIIDRAERAER